ncbi:MAG: hypothetical protein Ct9H300mP28_14990 [Pseudomonadota bacterium]|nr:MAG: hypothetical protein Ct9H300mP28_14990 [Pseudomonadota bacterium]
MGSTQQLTEVVFYIFLDLRLDMIVFLLTENIYPLKGYIIEKNSTSNFLKGPFFNSIKM